MQKVEGSNPFSRFAKGPANRRVFSFLDPFLRNFLPKVSPKVSRREPKLCGRFRVLTVSNRDGTVLPAIVRGHLSASPTSESKAIGAIEDDRNKEDIDSDRSSGPP
jgi:hypothetical protein